MGISLTPQTARKLKSFLQRPVIGERPKTTGTGTGRHDLHVKITGAESGGYYPCVPTYYDTQTESWFEFFEQRAVSANGETLTEDKRYRAICYGVVDVGGTDYLLFGCGEPSTGSTGVDCGLYYDGDTGLLNFDYEGVVGDGLEVDYENCPSGSSGSSSSGSDCCPVLKVKGDCGIVVDENGVSVDTEALAGSGLKTTETSGECPKLAIDDELSDGPTWEAVTDIYPDGCGFCYDYTVYTARVNSAGVWMGVESTTETFCEGLEECCDCDSDSDSDSSSGCTFPGAGWYCCEETQTVTYITTCEEYHAYVCVATEPGSSCEEATLIDWGTTIEYDYAAYDGMTPVYAWWKLEALPGPQTFRLIVSGQPEDLTIEVYGGTCGELSFIQASAGDGCNEITYELSGHIFIQVGATPALGGTLTMTLETGGCP